MHSLVEEVAARKHAIVFVINWEVVTWLRRGSSGEAVGQSKLNFFPILLSSE